MISVDTALAHLFDLIDVLPAETVPLTDAAGRVLAEPVTAQRDQPPFDASAMDGYAVRAHNATPGQVLHVIGEAAAGHRFDRAVNAGQAARIFTGAPVPEGADTIVLQEDVDRTGDQITILDSHEANTWIRPAGGDFSKGAQMDAPRQLGPSDVSLLAAMNTPVVSVRRKPVVALIATGDELVMPGETPSPDQIIASNSFGLKALLQASGAEPRLLPIARDNVESLGLAFDLAQGADLVVTIGGASVGDHDLVGEVAAAHGMQQSFYKVAMRPGKPLMAGRIGASAMVGLPGNPVSALVCGHVFLVPMIRAMLGLGAQAAPRRLAPLAVDIGQNGPREHYMRATLDATGLTPATRQDSSLLSVISAANALLIRAPHDEARKAGEMVEFLSL